MVYLLEGSPISTEELWRSVRVAIGFLVTSLTKAHLPLIAVQFGWAASSRMSLAGSKRLPFKNDGGHCVIGNLQCCRHFFGTLPQICASTQSCLGALRTILLTPVACFFSLTCTVNCGSLYRQVCAFPNHVQSIEITTDGLQVVETSQRSMETGCT